MKKIFAFVAAMTFAVAVISCGPKAEQAAEETAPATETPVVADSTVAAPADSAVVAPADSAVAK